MEDCGVRGTRASSLSVREAFSRGMPLAACRWDASVVTATAMLAVVAIAIACMAVALGKGF